MHIWNICPASRTIFTYEWDWQLKAGPWDVIRQAVTSLRTEGTVTSPTLPGLYVPETASLGNTRVIVTLLWCNGLLCDGRSALPKRSQAETLPKGEGRGAARA